MYYAHLCDHKLPESLKEHVEKVNSWFLKITEIQDIDSVVNRLIHSLIIDCEKIEHKKEVGDYIKELFLNAIIFHDFGKIITNNVTSRNTKHYKFCFKKKKSGQKIFSFQKYA